MDVGRVVLSDHFTGWAFASPAVLLILAFGLIPIVWSAILSFQSTNLLNPPKWVGLANYKSLPKDLYFTQSMIHALIYSALFVPLSVAGGLLTAVALNRKIRGVKWYRTAIFVPVVVSTIATAIIFLWVFDPHIGIADWILGRFGLGPYGFFESPTGGRDSRVG